MISLDEARRFMNTSPGADPEVQELRDATIAAFEEGTGARWNAETGRVELHREKDFEQRIIWLDHKNVTNITQVRTREKFSSDWTTLTEYELDRNRLEFPDPISGIVEVTYDGGYASAPADIRQAILTQMLFLQTRLQTGKIDIATQGFEGGSTNLLNPNLHPLFKATIEKHRRV